MHSDLPRYTLGRTCWALVGTNWEINTSCWGFASPLLLIIIPPLIPPLLLLLERPQGARFLSPPHHHQIKARISDVIPTPELSLEPLAFYFLLKFERAFENAKPSSKTLHLELSLKFQHGSPILSPLIFGLSLPWAARGARRGEVPTTIAFLHPKLS